MLWSCCCYVLNRPWSTHWQDCFPNVSSLEPILLCFSYRGWALSHLLLEHECILDYLQDAVPKYNICIFFLCLVWDYFFLFQDRVRLDPLVLFQLFTELCLLPFNLLSLNHQFEIYNVYFPYIHNFRSS